MQPIVNVFVIIGAIVISAIAFNYPGNIQLKFGVDGIQVQVDGGDKSP